MVICLALLLLQSSLFRSKLGMNKQLFVFIPPPNVKQLLCFLPDEMEVMQSFIVIIKHRDAGHGCQDIYKTVITVATALYL